MSDIPQHPGLTGLGWNPRFESAFAPFQAEGLEPARVAVQEKELYVCLTGTD